MVPKDTPFPARNHPAFGGIRKCWVLSHWENLAEITCNCGGGLSVSSIWFVWLSGSWNGMHQINQKDQTDKRDQMNNP